MLWAGQSGWVWTDSAQIKAQILTRVLQVKRTLRVFISNTAHDQEWQKQHDDQAAPQAAEGDQSGQQTAKPQAPAPVPDLDSGKNIPGWVLRVEGRLIDVSKRNHKLTALELTVQSGNARLDKVKRKFTSFIKSAVVEFDQREAPTYPEGNIVEVCSPNMTLIGDRELN